MSSFDGEILANPYCVVELAAQLTDTKPTLAEEDWVRINADLIKHLGPADWLNVLLAILTGKQVDSDLNVVNPARAIVISSSPKEPHELVVSKSEWVKYNSFQIKDLSAEVWLWSLLGSLR